MSDAGFRSFMPRALALARAAADAGEVPIGAVIVKDGQVIAEAHNSPRTDHDPTAHAEILAIRRAAEALGDERLTGCDLWVTLEPCAMCAGAIAHARIRRLYYAASDPKGGAVEHGARVFEQEQCLHRPEIYSGIGEAEAADILRVFFRERRCGTAIAREFRRKPATDWRANRRSLVNSLQTVGEFATGKRVQDGPHARGRGKGY